MDRMTSPRRGLAYVLPLALVLACGPEPTAPSLEDRVFLSQSVTEDGAPRVLVGATRLRLEFFEAPRVGASAGCNSLSGRYAIDQGSFVLMDAAQTERGCDPELHEQDAWYFGFLGSRPSIVVEGDGLVLDGSGTRIEYLDQEVATPDLELTGRTWTVDTIIEGGAAQHAEWPAPATLAFGTDGAVEIFTGCNSGSGSYRVTGAELSFSDVSVTERGCDGDTGRLESVVLGLLLGPQPVTWEITVDRLSLRGDDVGLELVASEG
jgi:heat shock protein HslJ